MAAGYRHAALRRAAASSATAAASSRNRARPHSIRRLRRCRVNFTVKDIHWAYHPDETVDVAVTPTFGLIDQNEFDVAYYNLADLVRPSATPYRVQCGDPICIVGLFHWHSGSKRNTPIVHFEPFIRNGISRDSLSMTNSTWRAELNAPQRLATYWHCLGPRRPSGAMIL
jgi:hypothetical protein